MWGHGACGEGGSLRGEVGDGVGEAGCVGPDAVVVVSYPIPNVSFVYMFKSLYSNPYGAYVEMQRR